LPLYLKKEINIMAKVKVVIPTGGNLPGETGTTTDNHSLEIDGTKYAKIPVQIDGVTYYLIAAEDWDWNAKT